MAGEDSNVKDIEKKEKIRNKQNVAESQKVKSEAAMEPYTAQNHQGSKTVIHEASHTTLSSNVSVSNNSFAGPSDKVAIRDSSLPRFAQGKAKIKESSSVHTNSEKAPSRAAYTSSEQSSPAQSSASSSAPPSPFESGRVSSKQPAYDHFRRQHERSPLTSAPTENHSSQQHAPEADRFRTGYNYSPRTKSSIDSSTDSTHSLTEGDSVSKVHQTDTPSDIYGPKVRQADQYSLSDRVRIDDGDTFASSKAEYKETETDSSKAHVIDDFDPGHLQQSSHRSEQKERPLSNPSDPYLPSRANKTDGVLAKTKAEYRDFDVDASKARVIDSVTKYNNQNRMVDSYLSDAGHPGSNPSIQKGTQRGKVNIDKQEVSSAFSNNSMHSGKISRNSKTRTSRLDSLLGPRHSVFTKATEGSDATAGLNQTKDIGKTIKRTADAGLGIAGTVGKATAKTIATTGRISATAGKAVTTLGGKLYSIGSPERARKWEANKPVINAKFDAFSTFSKRIGKEDSKVVIKDLAKKAPVTTKVTTADGTELTEHTISKKAKAYEKVPKRDDAVKQDSHQTKEKKPDKKSSATSSSRDSSSKKLSSDKKGKKNDKKKAKGGAKGGAGGSAGKPSHSKLFQSKKKNAANSSSKHSPFKAFNQIKMAIQGIILKLVCSCLGFCSAIITILTPILAFSVFFPLGFSADESDAVTNNIKQQAMAAMLRVQQDYMDEVASYYDRTCRLVDEDGDKLHPSHTACFATYLGDTSTLYKNLYSPETRSTGCRLTTNEYRSYNIQVLYTTIISLATIATGNETTDADFYEEYCCNLLKKILHKSTHSDSGGTCLIIVHDTGLTNAMRLDSKKVKCNISRGCRETFPAVNNDWMHSHGNNSMEYNVSRRSSENYREWAGWVTPTQESFLFAQSMFELSPEDWQAMNIEIPGSLGYTGGRPISVDIQEVIIENLDTSLSQDDDEHRAAMISKALYEINRLHVYSNVGETSYSKDDDLGAQMDESSFILGLLQSVGVVPENSGGDFETIMSYPDATVLRPGDILLKHQEIYNEETEAWEVDNHVLLFIGYNEEGKPMTIECGGSSGWRTLTHRNGAISIHTYESVALMKYQRGITHIKNPFGD